MTPLDYFKAKWNAAPPLGLPLVVPSAEDVDTDSLPDPWAGVLVQAQEFHNLTMGSQPWQEESGVFLVGVFTRAGDGFADTDAIARPVRDLFMNWTTADNVLRIESVAGPLDIDPDCEDGWHQLAMEMRYHAWTKGEEPRP